MKIGPLLLSLALVIDPAAAHTFSPVPRSSSINPSFAHQAMVQPSQIFTEPGVRQKLNRGRVFREIKRRLKIFSHTTYEKAIRWDDSGMPETHLSYLDRNQKQWSWLYVHALPTLYERAIVRAQRNQRPHLKLVVMGASTGEDLARAFHEVISFLEQRGEDVKKWNIEIVGLEKNKAAVLEGQKRFMGDRSFTTYERDESYTNAVISTLNRHAKKVQASLRLELTNILDPGQLASHRNADLIFVNNTLGHFEGQSSAFLKHLDDQWPEAVITGTYPKTPLPGPIRHQSPQSLDKKWFFLLPQSFVAPSDVAEIPASLGYLKAYTEALRAGKPEHEAVMTAVRVGRSWLKGYPMEQAIGIVIGLLCLVNPLAILAIPVLVALHIPHLQELARLQGRAPPTWTEQGKLLGRLLPYGFPALYHVASAFGLRLPLEFLIPFMVCLVAGLLLVASLHGRHDQRVFKSEIARTQTQHFHDLIGLAKVHLKALGPETGPLLNKIDQLTVRPVGSIRMEGVSIENGVILFNPEIFGTLTPIQQVFVLGSHLGQFWRWDALKASRGETTFQNQLAEMEFERRQELIALWLARTMFPKATAKDFDIFIKRGILQSKTLDQLSSLTNETLLEHLHQPYSGPIRLVPQEAYAELTPLLNSLMEREKGETRARKELRELLRQLRTEVDSLTAVFVIYDQNQMTGVHYLNRSKPFDGHRHAVGSTVIATPLQGRGLGPKLIVYGLEWMKREGYRFYSANMEQTDIASIRSSEKAFAAAGVPFTTNDLGCEWTQYVADLSAMSSILDVASNALINKLWEILGLFSNDDESAFTELFGHLNSLGWRGTIGNEQSLMNFLNNRLDRVGLENFIDIQTIGLWTAQNIAQHGGNRGIFLLRVNQELHACELVFLDAGNGFINKHTKQHVPIHAAVDVFESFGVGGRNGLGLTIAVKDSDNAEITTFSLESGTPVGHIWRKGDAAETQIQGLPIVNKGTKFVSRIKLRQKPTIAGPASLAFWIVLAITKDVEKAIHAGQSWVGIRAEQVMGPVLSVACLLLAPSRWWFAFAYYSLHVAGYLLYKVRVDLASPITALHWKTAFFVLAPSIPSLIIWMFSLSIPIAFSLPIGFLLIGVSNFHREFDDRFFEILAQTEKAIRWVRSRIKTSTHPQTVRVIQKQAKRTFMPKVFQNEIPPRDETIRRIQAALASVHSPRIKIALFGSFERDEQDAWSDLDIMISLPDRYSWREWLDAYRILWALRKYGYDIEPAFFGNVILQNGRVLKAITGIERHGLGQKVLWITATETHYHGRLEDLFDQLQDTPDSGSRSLLDSDSNPLMNDLWAGIGQAQERLADLGWQCFRGTPKELLQAYVAHLTPSLSSRGTRQEILDHVYGVVGPAMENILQHGDNCGTFLWRINDDQGTLELVFLDAGKGFLDEFGKHVPIHRAVRGGKRYGKGGKHGVALATSITHSNDTEITTYSTETGKPIGYLWRKNDGMETRLQGTPPVQHGTKYVARIQIQNAKQLKPPLKTDENINSSKRLGASRTNGLQKKILAKARLMFISLLKHRWWHRNGWSSKAPSAAA